MAQKQPSALAKYTKLRKQAKQLGITVPRGTSMDELQSMVKACGGGGKKKRKKKRKRKRRSRSSSKIHWGW